ncbi:MAG TPA: transposase [Oligoflexus sp.]|uniref:transposase n=1 Tax=Oligoflexus sp. TaxID=1971216 RepID=UPI002D4EB642|nr:transposase [Oligoflexus sp.]HYX38903.1 transposase [Oligoflexus sp.]
MMDSNYMLFVGIDWATEEHEVCVISDSCEKQDSVRIANGANGLLDISYRLSKAVHGHLDTIAIQLSSEEMIVLREMSRLDEDLAQSRNRLTNQIREQVMRFHSDLLKLSPSADEPWFWDLLEATGDSGKVKSFSLAKVRNMLAKYHVRRHEAEDVMQAAKAKRVTVAPGTTAAAMLHIKAAIAQMRVVDEQRKQIRKEITALLGKLAATETGEDKMPDVTIILSVPGIGSSVAAMLLTEASQALAELDYRALRAYSGIAPVTKRSGKRLSVMMRQACNERLRNAIYHWCRVSIQRDDISRNKYAPLRAKGHSHGRSLRTVGDSLLRLLFSMLRHRTIHDPTRRLVVA